MRCRRSSRLSDGVPCDVLKPVVLSVVEDVTEPLVRVEREHGDVRVRMSEGGDVGGERGVVVDDVLLVERDVGRADMSRRPLERWHAEEEVRPAQVVGVCVGLCGRECQGWPGGGGTNAYHGTEKRLHLGLPEGFEVELEYQRLDRFC